MKSDSADQPLQRYKWASAHLAGLIQGPPSPPVDATDEEIRQRALARLERLRQFLAYIGNPHLVYKTLHVGGTSGKGSTSAFLASILTTAGYRTGLHVTPYLQVETEKLQLNDRLMSGDQFAGHVEALDEQVRAWESAGNDRLTYGEFWVALTFFAFQREACDVVVSEVGAGGRFDLTNLVQPEVAVITSVGLDHVRTLGGTIPEIAWHKAGIIKADTPAVTTVQDEEALPVIRDEARSHGTELVELRRGRDYHYSLDPQIGGTLRMDGLANPVRLPLPGPFQASNAAAAIKAVQIARDAGSFSVSDEQIIRGIERTRFPGRVEITQERPQVVLDGAHNPEKVSALVETLELMPQPARRILVLGSLGGHDFLEVARIIIPKADEVIVTAPSAIERPSAPVDDIVEVVTEVGRPYQVELDPLDAIRVALERAQPDDQVVVTGSLYLVGATREYWYPSREIVLQQTPWPVREG
jgi:dihydrofolate synthase / folylpolyglutamate synthase